MLCQGGVCKYRMKTGSGLTDKGIASNIANGIMPVFESAVGAILEKALLWVRFDSKWQEKVLADI